MILNIFQCVTEPYIECNDVAFDIPYLEPAEECQEVVFDDCVEVRSHQIQTYSQTKTGPLLSQIEERIPVELCTQKRLARESSLLSRGPVFRKEGEKRRRKIGEEEGRKCLSEDDILKARDVAEAEEETRRGIARLCSL